MKKTLTLLLCISLMLSALCTLAYAADSSTGESTAPESSAATGSDEQSTSEPISTEPATSPVKAQYQLINPAMGYGSGTVFIEMPAQSNATSFALYWGDASGKQLANHTSFLGGTITSENVSLSTSEGFSIPTGAKTVLLYTYTKHGIPCTQPYRIDLPAYTLPETGKLLDEYVIVADLHIGSNKAAENHLLTMLTDVKNTAPDAAGIIVAGDAVHAADESYYLLLGQLCDKVPGAPKLYLGAGDYTYLAKGTFLYDSAKHAEYQKLFLKYAGHPFGITPEHAYYSYKLGEALMVFLAADEYRNGSAYYSPEQLTWLDGILAGADAYAPVFIFMHEPLSDTVSGSLSSQGYNGINNPRDVREVLKKYKNPVIFSGHTHWSLEAERTMSYVSGGGSAFHTGAVSGLKDFSSGTAQPSNDSHGYYVTLYENAVLIRGRNFATGEWISNAVYMFSTKPIPQQSEKPTSATKPSATKAPASSEEQTEESEESGFRDLIPPLCILACMAVVVFIFVFRKPTNQE